LAQSLISERLNMVLLSAGWLVLSNDGDEAVQLRSEAGNKGFENPFLKQILGSLGRYCPAFKLAWLILMS
jgi:hypothetical protein